MGACVEFQCTGIHCFAAFFMCIASDLWNVLCEKGERWSRNWARENGIVEMNRLVTESLLSSI